LIGRGIDLCMAQVREAILVSRGLVRLVVIKDAPSIAGRSHHVHARRPTLGPSSNPPEPTMHPELRRFLSRFIGTVLLTLIPVIFIAFLSMPINLNGHPGEPAPADLPMRHMT
jgi:hypothetical protein